MVGWLACLCWSLWALASTVEAVGWLALVGMSGLSATDFNDPSRCIGLRGLTRKQIRLCKKNAEHMLSIRQGAAMALRECQEQFHHSVWNCSLVRPLSLFGATLPRLPSAVISQDPHAHELPLNFHSADAGPLDPWKPSGARKTRRGVEEDVSASILAGLGAVGGSREAAFVHAISAAGVAHKVTRDCSEGRLSKCGCDSSHRGDSGQGFQWAGCSDNVHYGAAFSRKFVDAEERKKRLSMDLMLANLHNNEAGRQVIQRQMGLQCKCHGVSGSCELKTCWRAMPKFRKVGDVLKRKFDGATEVKLGKGINSQGQTRSSRSVLVPVYSYLKEQTKADLVFLRPSPNYCAARDAQGIDTAGRVCNASSSGPDGCGQLCCRRGFRQERIQSVHRCECKFHWCCEVKCQLCHQTQLRQTCR